MLQSDVALTDAALDALGNPERRRMLRLLGDGPKSVGELAGAFTISRPAVSRHLAQLRRAGLVSHRGQGNRNLYSLDVRGFDTTHRWLDSFWSEAEIRLRLLAETLPEDGSHG